MKLVLHQYWRSSAAYRVRIALALKGVEYESLSVDLLKDEHKAAAYREANPQGLVPLLEAGGTRITQSLAIIFWLDARYPDPPLMPADPDARARVHAMALVVACDIHPFNNMRVLRHIEAEYGVDEVGKKAWISRWMVEGLEALEALAGKSDGPWLSGAAPGLADICLIPQLYNARRFDVPLDFYPSLLRADAEADRHPAFQAAHPDRFKS